MPDASAFWAALEALHFLRPAWLVALAPLALFAWLHHRAADPVRRFGDLIAPELLPHLVVNPQDHGPRFRPVHLIVLLLALGILGAAGPAWQRQPSPFAAETAPVMIALDMSRPMDAIDITPSRLERAKLKVRDFVAGRPGAATGLLAYAGSAHLVLPPTDDPEVFATFLDALSTPLMPVPGNDPGGAIAAAMTTLNRQDVAGTVVVVAGSFEDPGGRVARLVAGSPHQVLLLAVGTERGGPIRVGNNDFLEEDGRRVISRLEPAQLDAAADAGIYATRTTVDDTDVRRLLSRTQSHLERALTEDTTQEWNDAGYWLTWPVALLAVFWFRRGWTVRWEQVLAAALATALVGLAGALPTGSAGAQDAAEPPAGTDARAWWADLWWTPDQQARRLFESGDFAAAATRFEDPAWRGTAAYRAQDWDAAIDAFAALNTPEASYNLGNAYARKGEYERAIAAYEQAIAARPDWPEARANRDFVASLIPPESEDDEEPQSQADPTFAADQVEFDLDEDRGSTGEVPMAAFTDDQMAEMWLRQLTSSPAGFLRTKFAIQAARADAGVDGGGER